MIALGAAGWAWISYALVYSAGVRAARPHRSGRRAVERALGALSFAFGAWSFGHVEDGVGGVLMAALAWTLAASLYPFIERTEPHAADASIGVAIVAAVLGTFHAA